jgi:hypothetical protein
MADMESRIKEDRGNAMADPLVLEVFSDYV